MNVAKMETSSCTPLSYCGTGRQTSRPALVNDTVYVQCSAVADGYLNCESGQHVYFSLTNTEGSSKNGNKSSATPRGYRGRGRETWRPGLVNDTVCGQCSAVADGYLACESGRHVDFSLKNTEGRSKSGNKSSGTPLGYRGRGRQTW